MKKINRLQTLSYFVFVLWAWPARAQVVTDSLTKTVEFPLVRQNVQLQAQASVLLPALVGESRFKNSLSEDCRKFEESYNQYVVHIDDLSRELANSVRELALAYTMKPQYELYLGVDLMQTQQSVDSSRWSLLSEGTALQFADESLMGLSKKMGLEQRNIEVDAGRGGVLAIRSRDLACDLLAGRAQLKSVISVEVQADERFVMQAQRVAQAWLEQIQSLEKTNMNDRQKAAWLGFQFESFKKRMQTDHLTEYFNVHYFFETFLKPDQIVVQPQWKSDLSQNWKKTIQVTLPVGVERL